MAKPTPLWESIRHLRARGHKGGTILQHRAIWSLRLPMQRLLSGLALAAGFTTGLLLLRNWIGMAWAGELLWWIQALELPGRFEVLATGSDGWLPLPVPFIGVELSAPNGWATLWQGGAVVLLWVCTGWVPDEAKPVAFFIRLAALVHGASVLFFMFWPASFTHSVDDHVSSGLGQAWYLMLLTPWIHLATYYLFPFAFWKRGLLTLLTLVFLFVLVPLLYALHVALIQQFGLILMPLLHLLFGVMLMTIGFVALYGWAMGWQTAGQRPGVGG